MKSDLMQVHVRLVPLVVLVMLKLYGLQEQN